MHRTSPGPRLLLALLVSACGPEKGSSTGDDTGTGETTAATSTTTTPTTGAADSTTAPTTGASTSALECSDYASTEEPGPALQLTLQYAGEGPVWVDAVGCGGLPMLTLVDAAAQPLLDATGSCYPTFCEQFLAEPDCQPSCDDCAPPRLLRLDPGASITVMRPGVRLTPLQMTAECAPGAACQRECLRADVLPAGDYTVQVTAYSSCAGDCDCSDPPVDGWCRVFGEVSPGDPVTASVTLTYPDTFTVTVPIGNP